eukprot:3830697-Rhodomonas_salina.1
MLEASAPNHAASNVDREEKATSATRSGNGRTADDFPTTRLCPPAAPRVGGSEGYPGTDRTVDDD